MKFPLSNDDIKTLLNCDDRSIVKYSDLDDDYSNLNELFRVKQFVVILVEYEHHEGHWVAMYKLSPTKFVFFNSFGDKYDYYMTEIPKYKNKELGNEYAAIGTLGKNTPKASIEWNKIQFQDDLSDTCGAWVVLFINLMAEYKNLLKVQQTLKNVNDNKLHELFSDSTHHS